LSVCREVVADQHRPMVSRMEPADVLGLVRQAASERVDPLVVGISGYGGSGKSTLTRHLVDALPGSIRMRGDDFLDPKRSHVRSKDWDGVERVRLASEVLVPFRERRASVFRRYDWSRRALGAPEPVPTGDILIVDLVGLFHPDCLDALDVRVWCDVGLETATHRGMKRDAQLGRDHSRLWKDVWVPNEIDFAENFSPRAGAHALYTGGPVNVTRHA
jgi:uridine kinase